MPPRPIFTGADGAPLSPLAHSMPSSVKIGGFDFAIVQWRAQDGRKSRRYGETDFHTLEIRVDTENYPASQIAHTLLHEVMHAIFWVWPMETNDEEERVVQLASNGLFAVMRDNPGLFDWIRSCLGTPAP